MTFSPRWCTLPIRMRRATIFLGLIVLFSATLAGAPVRVEAPAELTPAWERLISSHPFPADLEGVVTVREGALPGFRIVEVSAIVPVVRLWDPPPVLTRAQAESGGVRLLPLESVSLPDIAIPIDGLYPGDAGYPLMRRMAIGIQGDDDKLRLWFEGLPDMSPRDSPPRIRWIGAVGDIMPARGVDAALVARGGLERVLGDTLPLLRGLDMLVGNLEAAASTRGARAVKTYTFRFDPRALASLSSAGFSYLSVANNHTFDFGKEGFLDTLASLPAAGIATSGAGATIEEASRPAVMSLGGTEVRLLSFAAYPVDRTGFDGRVTARAAVDRPGTLWLDDEGMVAAARGFSRDAFNIALVHGGVEWSTIPTGEQKQKYRELVRAGADLVIGSHPHVLQGLEAVDGKLIAYSLGNFLFPGMEGTPGGEESLILEVGTYGRRIVSVRGVPMRLRGGTVRLRQGNTPVPLERAAGVQ